MGSTAIAEGLDPEEWREVVAGAHRRVGDAVARYEGTIAQLLGDGVLAFFGAPVAHEDDPTRAVQAALAIQAAMVAYAHELAGFVDGFALRIGIHTGEVVAGAVGAAGHVEYLAIGDSVNLAARLQSAAAPGKVLISESTARLVRGAYELTSRADITVKGKAAPVAVYEVAGMQAGATRQRGLLATGAGGAAGAPRASPLVGRDAELVVLTGALERLCEGHGAIVALLGEAGIGKSRLVEEAQAWAASNCRELRWLEGRALSYGGGLSYWPIGQLIRADLGLSDSDAEVRARVALRRRLNRLPWGPEEAADVGAYLAHLLGLRAEGEAAKRLAALDSETLKYQLLVSLSRYFSAVAAQQPLVLVCEDVHWADPSTLDALSGLLALTDHAPLLILLVMRAEREHGSWRLKVHAETEHPHRYVEVALWPLGQADAQRLVDHLLGTPDPADWLRSLQQLLLERAEGNPFFLEELVAGLVEQGALARRGEDHAWRVNRPVEYVSIPDTVQGVILARLDRLEDDVRLTLQIASVIGRSFLYRLLQAVTEAERRLDRHLVALQRADLVREKAVRPQLEYIFKHALAQEATYGSLLLERRREFHRRVGEALEQMYAGRQEEVWGLLAHHFDLAEQGEQAVRYLMAAGDKARLEDALAEAAGFYRRAVERLEAMEDAEQAARTWLKLALVHQADFDHAAAYEAYERGFSWRQRVPRQHRSSPDADTVYRSGDTLGVHCLDPGRVVWSHEDFLARQLYAGLAEIDGEMNVVPDGARSWEVLDEGRCWRIYLRDDVLWTDGRPVTAHDYAYAWLRNLTPGLRGDSPAGLLDDVVGARAYRLGQVSDPGAVGIRAIDDHTLEVRLAYPVAYFPYLLAQPVTFPLPRRVLERWGAAAWQPEHIVSNGAFRLVHFEPARVVLEHNPEYFGSGSGNLARFERLVIPDEAERVERFRRGELEQITCFEVPADLAARVSHSLTLSVHYILLVARPPLDDVRVRRAIAMAVDWRALAERMAVYPATGGLVPPGMPGHTPGLALPHDPGQARHLLGLAGYPEVRGLPGLVVTAHYPRAGAAVTELLRAALPVEVDLRLVSPQNWPEDIGEAHLIIHGWAADLPDPDNFLRQSNVRSMLSRAGWRDPEMDALLERAAQATDRAGRMAVYRLADRRLVAEQAVAVPVGYSGSSELIQPWVRGAFWNKLGMGNLKDAVVDRRPGA